MATLDLDQLNTLPALVQSLADKVTRLTVEVACLREAMPPKFFTPKEAAARLSVSMSTIRRMMKAKPPEPHLKTIVIGGRRLVDLSDLTASSEDDIAKLVSERRRL